MIYKINFEELLLSNSSFFMSVQTQQANGDLHGKSYFRPVDTFKKAFMAEVVIPFLGSVIGVGGVVGIGGIGGTAKTVKIDGNDVEVSATGSI